MKKLYSILIAGACLLTFGCDEILTIEEKLDGEWYYDRVTVSEQGSIFNRNITNEYRDVTLDFEQNGDVTMTFGSTNTVYEGRWDVERQYSQFSDSSVRVLELLLVDYVNQDVFEVEWELNTLTRNRITAKEFTYFRDITYRLRKRE